MEKQIGSLAKTLRKRSKNTENYLWLSLKNRQLEGAKFRRQEPMGKYIADFVSYERKLVIELDGSQHVAGKEKDKIRDKWFREQGYLVLRFWDNEVLKNKDGVLEKIRITLLTPHLASPTRGEG